MTTFHPYENNHGQTKKQMANNGINSSPDWMLVCCGALNSVLHGDMHQFWSRKNNLLWRENQQSNQNKNLRMLGDLNLARLLHSLSLDYTDSSCLWDYGFILKQYGVIRKSFHDNQCYEKINTISLKIYAVRRRSLSIITITWTHHLYRADI